MNIAYILLSLACLLGVVDCQIYRGGGERLFILDSPRLLFL